MRESKILLKDAINCANTLPIKSMALDLQPPSTAPSRLFWDKRQKKNVPSVRHVEILLKVSEGPQCSSFASPNKMALNTLSPSKADKNMNSRRYQMKNPMYRQKPVRESASTVEFAKPKPNNYKLFPKR